MSVRYLSSEQMIAAAGAAFACPDDDFSIKRSAARGPSRVWVTFKRVYLKTFIAFGFVLI